MQIPVSPHPTTSRDRMSLFMQPMPVNSNPKDSGSHPMMINSFDQD